MNRREFLAAGLSVAPLLRCAALPVVSTREPIALVTADTEAHVAIVSLAGHRVVRRVGTIEGPRSIQSGPGGVAIVGHSAAGAVTLLEGRPPRVRRVLRGFEQPRYTAFAADGGHAFVTDSGSGELAVIDLRRGRVVRRVRVGALARHVTVDPGGRRLWISLGTSAAAIAVVDITDPVRPRLVRTVRPPFLVHDVGFSPSGRRVWLTAGREQALAVYRADGHGPVRRMRCRPRPAAHHVRAVDGLRRQRRGPLAPRPLARRRPPAARHPHPDRLLQRPARRRAGPHAVAQHRDADTARPPRARPGGTARRAAAHDACVVG